MELFYILLIISLLYLIFDTLVQIQQSPYGNLKNTYPRAFRC